MEQCSGKVQILNPKSKPSVRSRKPKTQIPIPDLTAHRANISAGVNDERLERMAKQALARAADLEPIDRLEEKIKLLVDMVVRLRADLMHAAEEHQTMTAEIDTLRARVADADGTHTELESLPGDPGAFPTPVA